MNETQESVVLDKDIIKVTDELGKQIYQAQDYFKKGLDEIGTKWADESAKTIDTLNGLKDTQDKQTKILEELEMSAARGEINKGFASKDRLAEIKSVRDWSLRRMERTQSESDIDIGLKNILLHEPTLALKYEKSFDTFKKDIIEGSLPQGGLWVLPYQYLTETITRVFETSPMRQVCRVQTITKPFAFEVIDDQQAGIPSTAQESQTIADTDTPEIGQITYSVHNISARLKVSDQMIQDSNIDVGQWAIQKGTTRIVRTQNTAFVSGSGSNEAKGILSYDKWGGAATNTGLSTAYETGKLQYILSGGANVITYNGLVNLQNSLVEDYQRDASWLMHRLTWGEILKLKDGEDRPLLQFMNLLSTGADNLPLLGRSVRFANDLVPSIGGGTPYTDGNVPVLYGDFNGGYSIFDRMGFQILFDPYTAANTFRIIINIKTRYGGGLTSYDRIKAMEVGAALDDKGFGAVRNDDIKLKITNTAEYVPVKSDADKSNTKSKSKG